MGHELSGEVVEVGSAVTNVKPGDRVVIETVLGDGQCEYCRIKKYNICPHLYEVRTKSVSRAYAEHVIGPSSHFYRLPDHVSFEEAALIDTFSVCLHAQHLSGLGINDRVAIIGAGPIGLGQLMMAKASGADVIILDLVEHSLEVAKELGADAVVNSSKEDAVERVKEFTGGRGADIVFECAGGESMPQTLPQATKMVRRGGKVVIIGGFDKGETSIPLEWQRIQMSEIQIIPSASFAFWDIYAEQGMVLELLGKGKLNAKKLITHRFDLDHINEAFEVAQNKQETGAIFVALNI
ncbi:alcohol dehydrogenase, partial [bacterium]